MITLFNRKELCTTFDLERQALIRDILAANKIDYKLKLANPGRSHTRGHAHSTIGMNLNRANQYTIYVKKDDFEKAKYLINR
ncbi:MAG: hypothetical protein IJ471_05535 [Eubacterium sp.]|nr:hypothetical protein [Eubacterium sp.]